MSKFDIRPRMCVSSIQNTVNYSTLPGWSPREHERARGGGQQGHAQRGLEEGQRLHHQRQDERQGRTDERAA